MIFYMNFWAVTRLFGDKSPDLELEGKRKEIRHKFRENQATRIA